ncbi:MAG: hypothetical protein QOF77_2390 [Solirubrobacteraceae bacterium]|jgi:hypothetical protein|nr:hypothetical protein [Solirubrobacteraceae bacterium]
MVAPRLALLLTAGALAGCGGSSSPTPAVPARAADFPSAARSSYQALSRLPAGPALAPSVSLLRVGSNRFGFALFTVDHKQVSDAEVALYTLDTHGRSLAGPYPAHLESLAVAPQYQSQTVAQDPTAAHSVYVAQVRFARPGKQNVIAVERIAGQLRYGSGVGADVGAPGPPDVGQPAISVHTPTVGEVGRANLATIDTRQPPAPDLQQVDFASVLHRKPVVLLFATPQLCASRVCGPVTDIEEQVKSQIGDRVAFVHMEIYNENQVNKGFRPQVVAWRLPTEPWAFVIGRDGRIATRLEGAFSVAELHAAVARVL